MFKHIARHTAIESEVYEPAETQITEQSRGKSGNEALNPMNATIYPESALASTLENRFTRKQWDDASFIYRITYIWLIPFFRKKIKFFSFLENMFRLPKLLQIDDSLNDMVQNWEKEKVQPDPQLWKVVARTFWRDWLWFSIPHQFNTVISLFISQVVGRLIDCLNDECEEWEGYFLIMLLFVMLVVSNTLYSYGQCLGSLIGAKIRTTLYAVIYNHALKLKLDTAGSEVISVAAADAELLDDFDSMKYVPFVPVGLILSTAILYMRFGVSGLIGTWMFVIIVWVEIWIAFRQRQVRLEIGEQTDERLEILTSIIEGIRVVKMYAWEFAYEILISKLRHDELMSQRKNAVYDAFYWAVLITMSGLILLPIFYTYIALGNELTSSSAFTAASTVVITLNVFVGRPAIAFGDLLQISAALSRMGEVLQLQTRKAKYAKINPNKGVVLEQLSASWKKSKEDQSPELSEDVEETSFQDESIDQSKSEYGERAPQNPDSPFSAEYIEESENDDDDVKSGLPQISEFDDDVCSIPSESDEDEDEYFDPRTVLRRLQTTAARTTVADVRQNRTSMAMSNDTISFISLEVEKGDLAVIIGPTGSGKSSLLSSILGEMNITRGSIKIGGTFAYVAQEPWIRAASLKDNIIMAWPYDEGRYNQVIDVCSLTHDLEILTNGDETMLGDSGSNLSGGQMARISLARAVYSDADVYLLDDPLSAVDGKVRHDLYNRCICNFLRNKTRILVTHQLAVVQNAKQIICLNNGMFVVQGNFNSIQKHPDITALLGQIAKEQEEKELRVNDTILNAFAHMLKNKIKGMKIQEQPKEKEKSTLNDEEESIGEITFSMFKKYWSSGGIHRFILILLLFTAVQVLYVAIPFWIATWAAADDQEDPYYAWVFFILSITLFLGGFIRTLLLYWFGLQCNENIHKKLLSSVVHAPVSFFDSNPSGRLINRFITDQITLDDDLQYFQNELMQTLFTCASNAIIIIVITPLTLVAMTPLLIFIYLMYRMTIPFSEEAKRTELIYKSPIFNEYTSGLAGLPTIRAFGYENQLMDVMKQHIDNYLRCTFSFQTLRLPFQYYTDLGGTLFVTVNTLLVYIMRDNSSGDISLSLAVGFAPILAWAMGEWVDQRFYMTSFARTLQYCNLEPEAASNTEKSLEIKAGKVEFREVCMRYRPDLNYALKNLTLVVEPGSKVGIVGRTGSGKSTILQTLFRLVEVHQGQILIDDSDTQEVGLHDLRKQISVIPQKPFIFPDSIAQNLDPFDQFSSEQLWDALEAVSLRKFFEEQPDKLETNIVDTVGLSVGQQQLVCLARAILSNNKILILDEATANIDLQTDETIQQSIRQNFSNCTIFSIAHRLETIIDSDKIIVMDSGECKEYASPAELLRNPASILSQMVDALGEADSKKLRKQVQRQSLIPESEEENKSEQKMLFKHIR